MVRAHLLAIKIKKNKSKNLSTDEIREDFRNGEIIMNGVLIIERAILESLEKRSMKLSDLIIDLGLDKEIVTNALGSLIGDKLIVYDGKKYELNHSDEGRRIHESIDSLSCVTDEKTDIALNMPEIGIHKFELDSFEEKLLNIHLKNFREFIEGIKQAEQSGFKKSLNSKLSDKKLILFGVSKYGDVLRRSVNVRC